LDVVVDAETATQAGAPHCTNAPFNVVMRWTCGDEAPTARINEAEVVVRQRIGNVCCRRR